MKKLLLIILIVSCKGLAVAQTGFAFNRISTEDGIGLASNVVKSLYQDAKGFIWVGTDNGLQRFDGSKFIQFGGTETPMPRSAIARILPVDSSKLFLVMENPREFGIFDLVRFHYKKIPLKPGGEIPPRAEYHAWQDEKGAIYLAVNKYGLMRYDPVQQALIDESSFPFPIGWAKGIKRVFSDPVKKQVWFSCDSGLCVYDRPGKQMWYRNFNPQQLPVLDNERVQDGISSIFIDKKRRHWISGWPKWNAGNQQLYCLDSTTATYLTDEDTAGIRQGPVGYVEYHDFHETKVGDLWAYGNGVLFNYSRDQRRFNYIGSDIYVSQIGIAYESVFQVMDDRDGSIWIATNQGLYFTSSVTGTFSVINILFDNKKSPTEITDILELPNGDFWLTSWGNGVKSLDKYLKKTEHQLYSTGPPAHWSKALAGNSKLTWSMCLQKSTGNIWVGCNGGVLLVHDPVKKTTRYLQPPEFGESTIRYITSDEEGRLWFGTQGGRLVKWEDDKFTVVQHFNTILKKLFFDKTGLLWVAAHEKGLYQLDAATGRILKNFTAGNNKNNLYASSGDDIEQLNDSTIVYGAGALNFINIQTGAVRLLTYEDGLPSNSVKRLRMDNNGFLWIVTSNGLCRYNPSNNRITSFGRRDGIVLAEKTTMADYHSRQNYLMFGGSNALVMFHPSVFSNTKAPPDVTITDFKLFNEYLPVDSLLHLPVIKLKNDQNSISIYFASLSFMQRDKLTYYYKMEGLDKEWIRADKLLYVNYSLMPPGKYLFKVYCENLEGIRSPHITQVNIFIKPPFWRTWWFLSVCLFVIALLIYVVHSLRVNKLLAVEKLRNNVARDLHDDMGSTLSTINILSSMAKSKMNSDAVKAGEYISKITDNSQRMMEAMDDIVWSIKPSNDSMQRIIARMREFATNVLESKDIELDFFADESLYDVKLNMQARRDLFLIFKEAVNNAAKYSRASKVEIKIQPENKKLLLLVKDDGRGFDISKADEGNGLGNMQKRADALMGKISINSAEGQGTAVKLTIPIS
jgi:ligand-binding sensor domain-containing protein/two-component sensor histidine kinase